MQEPWGSPRQIFLESYWVWVTVLPVLHSTPKPFVHFYMINFYRSASQLRLLRIGGERLSHTNPAYFLPG